MKKLIKSNHPGAHIVEKSRQKISNIVYRYTVVDGKIVYNSEIQIYGIKETSKILNTYIQDFSFYLKSGKVYDLGIEKYIFRLYPIKKDELINWKDQFPKTNTSSGSKFKEIWVYDAKTKEFIEKFY